MISSTIPFASGHTPKENRSYGILQSMEIVYQVVHEKTRESYSLHAHTVLSAHGHFAYTLMSVDNLMHSSCPDGSRF